MSTEITKYEVRNNLGIPRASITCGFCKEKWVEEVIMGAHGTKHRCDGLRSWLRVQAPDLQVAIDRQGPDRTWAFVANRFFNYKPIQWSDTGAPTHCDHRCMNAVGPQCDCQCNGKNHGVYAVKAVTKTA